MSALTMLPSPAARRELILAELRVERMRQQLVVAHLDYIATGVTAGFIPPESVPLMLAEVFGTAEGVADE
jgi:hypothetical protein